MVGVHHLFVWIVLWWNNDSVIMVHGWGRIGHQVVAEVAWSLLDNATQQIIQDTLQGEPTIDSICSKPCSPLTFVADWADTARHSQPFRWSESLHFIDILNDQLPSKCNNTLQKKDWDPICSFVPSRDCPDQFCVYGAIVNYTQQLMTASTLGRKWFKMDPEQSKIALMFLTHFVGDIHQPLHVSRKSDKGGNDIHVHLMNWTATPSIVRHLRRRINVQSHNKLNLHAVWDDSMIDTFLLENGVDKENRIPLQRAMIQTIQHAQQSSTSWSLWMSCPYGHVTTCVRSWAQESWILAQEHAYVHIDGVSPIVSGNGLPREYYEKNMPLVLERLAMAAARLAATLHVAFDGAPKH